MVIEASEAGRASLHAITCVKISGQEQMADGRRQDILRGQGVVVGQVEKFTLLAF